MLSSQQQIQPHYPHQQFHQFQYQIPKAMAATTGAITYCNVTAINNCTSTTTTTKSAEQQQQFQHYNSFGHGNQQLSLTMTMPRQQQQLICENSTNNQQHLNNNGINMPQMIIGRSSTTNIINDVGQQQPPQDATPWFFPSGGNNGQQQQQQTDSRASSPVCNSPSLMAPQQLLARFGPRHCTESVEVPSSEHVAEIVGRQGCKIKALRAKTNTYIKTPVRGEEPVFVVTGRHEDVAEARREIECAAEHFTQIRASRRHSQGACPAPGHVTAYVRVPLRVVGLVVGPKGNTIKRIQQDTHTYIITPSREREPIFEVTGLPQNVEAARREIENHIYQRTGNMPITDPSASIANYDLHSAVLQAQQSSLHTSNGQRPNYGALAINNAGTLFLDGGNHHGNSHTHYQQIHGQQQPFFHNQIDNDIGVFHTSAGHHGQPQIHSNKLLDFPIDGSFEHGRFHQSNDVQQFQLPNNNGSSTNTTNLHILLSAMELDAGIKTNSDEHANVDTLEAQSSRSPQLLAKGYNNIQQSIQLNGGNGNGLSGSAFSLWNSSSTGVVGNGNGTMKTAGGGVDFLDLISTTTTSHQHQQQFSSSTGCQSSFSSVNSSNNPFVGNGFWRGDAEKGITTSTECGGGLSSVNSSSRDEGLGDSPTNSFGRPQGMDPYQHLMTIWNDLVDQVPPNVIGNVPTSQQQEQHSSMEQNEQKITPTKETTKATAAQILAVAAASSC